MCGHVGVFGVISQPLTTLFEDLLNLDIVRGIDSVGVATLSEDGKLDVVKDTILPYQLLRDAEYHALLWKQKNNLLLGHNRWATKGGVNKRNAHPFLKAHIVMAHNGTLRGQWRLPDCKDFENDSENIAHAIATLGIEETWKLVDGAATLVYYDTKAQTLNIISNCERPFHYAWLKGGRALIWSSEEAVLKNAFKLNGIVPSKDEIYSPKSDVLYSFHMKNKREVGWVKKELEKFEAKWTYFDHKGDMWANKRHGVDGYWKEGKWHPFTAAIKAEAVRELGIEPLIDAKINSGVVLLPAPQLNARRNITEEEFKKTYSECPGCLNNLKQEYLTCTIVDDKIAFCKECTDLALTANIQLVH